MDVELITTFMYNIFVIVSWAVIYISIASLAILLGISLILVVVIGLDLIIEYLSRFSFVARCIQGLKTKKKKRQILNEKM